MCAMNKSKKSSTSIFDNAGLIVNVIIVLIISLLLLSQSWAINSKISNDMIIRSVLNHNTFYFLLLIYFIGIKLYIGKKYFNYLNLFLMVLYLIESITSIFTLVQSVSLNSLLLVSINVVLLIYLFHTLLRDTGVWKEYKLRKSPFNEISNELYYNFLFIVPTILLVVNLISANSFNGGLLYVLDYIYILLFARYIYLYRLFLDNKRVNINNDGNFDEIKKAINDKTNDLLENVKDTTDDIKDMVDGFVEDNKIDEKIDKAKDKVVDTTKDIKDKVNDLVDDGKINDSNKKKKKKKKKKGSE